MGNKYRHYKGKEYETIMLAQHTETLEPLVIYTDEDKKVWARPTKDFFGNVYTNGKLVRRFTPLDGDSGVI